jgi:hypothetical protein
MRMRNLWQLPAVALLALSVQGGCVLVPEIVDRIVELAVTGQVSEELAAVGIVNVHDDRDTVDVRAGLNLEELLDDNGIDVSNATSVSLAGATYRTIQLDPTPNREIQNGTVTIQRGFGGPEVVLIQNFNAVVNSVTTETTATLNPAGVAGVNALLADLLAEAKGGPPAANTVIIYHVTGNSLPAGVATDFRWELNLKINVVGTIEVEFIG